MKTPIALGVIAAAWLATTGAASAQLGFHPYIEHSFGGAQQEAGNSTGGATNENSGSIGQNFSVGLADVVGPFDLRLDLYAADIEREAGKAADNVEVDGFYLSTLYTQPVGDRFEVYAGGGVGKAELYYNSCLCIFGTSAVTGSGSGFSYQGIAGARAVIWKRLGAFIEGRYMRADDMTVDASVDTGGGPVDADFTTHYRALVVTGGLRLQF